MSRRHQHVAIWVVGAVVLLLLPFVAPPAVVTFVVICFVVLGVAGLWAVAPFARAQRLLAQRRLDEASFAFEEFEALARRQALRRHLAFLATGFSTSNAVALAVTGQALVRLEARRFDDAEALLARALQEDPGYALAWANRAIAAAGRGDEALATRCLEQAKAHGFERVEALSSRVTRELAERPR